MGEEGLEHERSSFLTQVIYAPEFHATFYLVQLRISPQQPLDKTKAKFEHLYILSYIKFFTQLFFFHRRQNVGHSLSASMSAVNMTGQKVLAV